MSQLPPPLPPETQTKVQLAPGETVLEYNREPQRQETFGIYSWAWIIYFGGLVAYLVAGYSLDSVGGMEHWLPRAAGAFVGSLIICFVPALLAFYIGRRSRLAASVTVVVLMMLACGGQVLSSIRVRQANASAAAVSQWTTQMQQSRDNMLGDLESQQGIDSTKARATLKAMTDATDRASASTGGTEAAVLRALSATLKRIADESAAHARNTDELSQKSPLTPGWIKSREDVAAARATIGRFRLSNNAMRSLISRMQTILQEELTRQNIPAKPRADLAATWSGKLDKAKPILASIRDADEELAKALLQACDVLDADWGKWQYDTEENMVRFDEPQSIKRFNDIIETVNRCSERETQAQREYVKIMK